MIARCVTQLRYRRQSTGPHGRRGLAFLMVLLLLSLTFGLSYAAMRSLRTVSMIQRNSDRRATARQAAITGLTMAIKKMHRSDWGGVDTSLTGSLNSTDSFSVTYTTGDPTLASNNADQPYRVTVLSTGYSADPQQPQAVASYRVRGVVRLIPRKMPDEPPDWTTMMNFTAYQWTSGSFWWDPPMRIEGPVRVQASMITAWSYSWYGNAKKQFFKDLNAMYTANRADWRPFTTQITLRKSSQILDTISVLNSYLGLPIADVSNSTATGMNYAGSFSTYRMYPGGKTYAIQQLPSLIQAATYQPDVTTNPAGLFYRSGAIEIGDDATVRGTIFTAANNSSRITISGKRVQLSAVNLPALQGTTTAVQLPVAAVADSLYIAHGANVAINGLVTVNNNYEVLPDDQGDITLTHQGKLIAQDIYFDNRSDWNASFRNDTWWEDRYDAWNSQKNNNNGYKYFPEYLQHLTVNALDPIPKIVIKPDTATIRYHWHDPQNTIYIADPADGGLRWDLVSWKENLE